jgi:oligosaccharyltransferase complex subunit alpha (ribophorin I)
MHHVNKLAFPIGNIAVEDIYELKHAGAVLKGGFSRFEYQARRGASSPSFRSLVASLPALAHDIYYRDQIGNISTSELRMNKEDIELEILTRFPMFGGWQTQFYIGYSMPTESALFIDGSGRYNLKFDFFSMFQDVWVEDMEVKVVLPEGSSDIQVNAPFATEQARSVRFTYLDSEMNGGRPVIIFKGKNLVEEHNEQVVVSYTFSSPRMLVEPMMLVASFFAFFLLCSIVVRMDTSSTSKEKKV